VAAPTRKDYLDYTNGSVRRGSVTYVGDKRVVVAERRGTCWFVGHQTRKAFDEGYLAAHDGRCLKPVDVSRIAKRVFK
jgi:hypothetical protein